jgi:hypothetical protein
MSALAESTPPGLVPPSSPQGRSGFLADVIVELDLADRGAVDEASQEARLQGATLAAVLVEKGVLDEHEVARAVAERHGLGMVDLEAFPVDPEAGALVGRATARRYGVLPAGFAPDGSLLLAMADPGNSLARNDVAVMTKLEVTPVIAPRTQIEAALEDLPETAVMTAGPEDQKPEGAAGAMLWQSEEPGDESKPEPGAQGLSAELARQKGRVADLEQELREARATLDKLQARYARELERRLADRGAA